VPGHLWLRDESARQNAVWEAINSVGAFSHPQGFMNHSKDGDEGATVVVIRSASNSRQHSLQVAKMIRDGFRATLFRSMKLWMTVAVGTSRSR